jgi:glycosyltransferase involved in cell wall biosynthesis
MNIMLISDLPPCANHTAGLLLNQLCDFLLESGHRVSAYIVKNENIPVEVPRDKVERITMDFERKPRENWGITRLKGIGSRIGDFYVTSIQLPKIIKNIVAFGRETQPDIIWGVVQGQTMARLIRPVANKLDLPYAVQIFDPIIWWFQANKVDKYTQKIVMREFGEMIHHSRCLIAASWMMASAYKTQYGSRDSVPVIQALDDIVVPPKGEKRNDIFLIVLSGQLYAYDSIMALLAGLNHMNWCHAGKRIVFKIYGSSIHFDPGFPCYIEYRGWIPQEELLAELMTADLLYCPYRFDADFEETARYSFPGKLSTYMKTGVPALVHGPYYCGINSFIKDNNAGYVCESLELQDIVTTIRRIIDDTKRLDLAKNAIRTLEEKLSAKVMRNNFFRALGIPLK